MAGVTVEDVTSKTEMVEIEPKSGVAMKPTTTTVTSEASIEEKIMNTNNGVEASAKEKEEKTAVNGKGNNAAAGEAQKEEIPVEVDPKTGVSFPVKLDDGKQLKAIGLRKKTMLGMGIKIYGFGIYADHEKLKDVLRSKIGKAPAKPTKEMFQAVVDSDVGIAVRLVIVFAHLTMNMVKKNFDEGLGAAIKKLTGAKNDDLTKKVMGEASDDIKLSPGSVIEISRLPGYTLQTKVMNEVVSQVQSELLCRAYVYLYLGDDPFDKEAKEKFGTSLLSLF